MRAERVLRIALDAGCILVGLGGIIHQALIVPVGQASEALLVACVSILGIPAGMGLLSQRTSGVPATTSSHAGSPLPDSSSQSSSSS